MRRCLLSLLLLAITVGGCSTTKAYQREKLADPVMSPDGEEDRETLRLHMLGTREGAVGGFGHGGGGCGCN